MGIKLSAITELLTGLSASHKIPYTTGSLTRLLRLDTLADWILQTYAGFTQSGSGATTRTVQAKVRGLPTTSEDYGTVDGTADDVQLQAAIDALNTAGGGKVILESNLAIAANVTLKSGVVLDTNGWKITPKTATASILVNEGAEIARCRMDCRSASVGVAYTGNAVKFTPTQHVNGAKWPNKWADNVQIEFDIGGGGVGVKMDASGFHVQEMTAGAITVYGGSKALELVSGATSSEYCNGNIFGAVIGHDCTTLIHENPSTGDVAGNSYHVMAEKTTQNCALTLNDDAHVTGLLWDRPTITFNGDNCLIVAGKALLDSGEITDNGYNNRVVSPRYLYEDRRSISEWGDARVDNTGLPGVMVFRDFIQGGKVDAKWTYSGVGTEAALSYTLTESGSATLQFCKTRARLETGTSTNDTAQLTWDVADVKTGQNPRLHCTVLSGNGAGSSEEIQVGLWQDANEHILFVSDPGNTRWICRVTVGGSSTDAYIAANFNRVQFLSIICDNSKVRFEHGEGTLGQPSVALGRSNMTSSAEVTNTSLFPRNEEMAPLVYIKTTTTAAAILFLYDFQLLRSYLSAVP